MARRAAWEFAQELAGSEDPHELITQTDAITADLGGLIRRPGPLLSTANLIIKAREVKDVRRIIEVLAV